MTDPLDYLRRLQAEAESGFHRDLGAWVDDSSSVARVLTAYAAGENMKRRQAAAWVEGYQACRDDASRDAEFDTRSPNPYREDH